MVRSCKYGQTFANPPASTLPKHMWQPTVDPEWAKVLMDEMAAEAGIETFFHSWGVDVIQDGNAVKGVVFESKEGRQAILASQVVDCTGDADMLFKAGGDYSQVTSPISTVFRWANMDTINPPRDSPAKLPRRGNEGNPDARWGHCGMETGNALSVRDLSRLEVEMRAGGAPSGAPKAYDIPSRHIIPGLHVALLQVGISRFQAGCMTNDHHVSVSPVVHGHAHAAVEGRIYRRSGRKRQVHAGMVPAPAPSERRKHLNFIRAAETAR